MRDYFADVCDGLGLHPSVEPEHLLLPDADHPDQDVRRPADVLLRAFGRRCPHAFDFACVSMHRDDVVLRAAKEACYAATAHEDFKRNFRETSDQCARDGITFVPMVVDSSGAWGPAAREVFQKLLRAAVPPLSRAQLPLSMQVRQKFNVLVRRSVAQSVLRRLQGLQPRRDDAPALELSVALAAAREASWHHQRLASRDAAAAESPRHVFPAASLAPTPALSSRPCAASASAAAPPLAAGVWASSGRDAVAPGPGRGSGVIFAHLGIGAVCPSAHGAAPAAPCLSTPPPPLDAAERAPVSPAGRGFGLALASQLLPASELLPFGVSLTPAPSPCSVPWPPGPLGLEPLATPLPPSSAAPCFEPVRPSAPPSVPPGDSPLAGGGVCLTRPDLVVDAACASVACLPQPLGITPAPRIAPPPPPLHPPPPGLDAACGPPGFTPFPHSLSESSLPEGGMPPPLSTAPWATVVPFGAPPVRARSPLPSALPRHDASAGEAWASASLPLTAGVCGVHLSFPPSPPPPTWYVPSPPPPAPHLPIYSDPIAPPPPAPDEPPAHPSSAASDTQAPSLPPTAPMTPSTAPP